MDEPAVPDQHIALLAEEWPDCRPGARDLGVHGGVDGAEGHPEAAYQPFTVGGFR